MSERKKREKERPAVAFTHIPSVKGERTSLYPATVL